MSQQHIVVLTVAGASSVVADDVVLDTDEGVLIAYKEGASVTYNWDHVIRYEQHTHEGES